jgi:3-hydroxybutyryl-CoA dehydrogenase
MQVVILCSEAQKEELGGNGIKQGSEIIWADELSDFLQYRNATAFVDLLFENEAERIKILNDLLPANIIIDSVCDTVAEINPSFIRITGWTTFLSSPIIEAAGGAGKESSAAEVFSLLNREVEWLPDVPGFVTPRIFSMIINEAYFALADDVSTKEEIDIAMKMGTAYPYGRLNGVTKSGCKTLLRCCKS